MSSHHVLLITGGEWHDFAAGSQILASALEAARHKVTRTEDAAALKSLAGSNHDCVVLYTQGDKFDDAGIDALAKFVRGGGGLVGIHCASDTNTKSETYMKLLGSQFINHGPVFDFKVNVTEPEHPIAHRIKDFRVVDELYVLKPHGEFQTFMTAWWADQQQPMAYSKSEGKGRVVYLANGHHPESLSNSEWQHVFVRSVRYAAGEDWAKKTVKVAAIGYGGAFNMGKLHLESCKRARLTPVAVSDIDPKRTASAKAELGEHIQTFTKVDDLLAKSDAEMCIIITPHNTHAPLSIQCLEAARHVVTEKPYTITIDEATKVIETARRVKKMATVFHNRRWDGDFMAIKKVINSGMIGDVFHIECAFGSYAEPKMDWWRANKQISGGAFYDWGAHFVDWILNLLPYKIESVSGSFHKNVWHQISNEDYTHAWVRFEGGRTASLEQSAISAIGKARFRVLGTKGGIEQKQGWTGQEPLRVVSFQNGMQIDGNVPALESDWDGFYRNVADHLLLGESLAVTPESARKVIAVLSLSEQSNNQKGAPLAVPFEQ